eukprot:g5415.t1
MQNRDSPDAVRKAALRQEILDKQAAAEKALQEAKENKPWHPNDLLHPEDPGVLDPREPSEPPPDPDSLPE